MNQHVLWHSLQPASERIHNYGHIKSIIAKYFSGGQVKGEIQCLVTDADYFYLGRIKPLLLWTSRSCRPFLFAGHMRRCGWILHFTAPKGHILRACVLILWAEKQGWSGNACVLFRTTLVALVRRPLSGLHKPLAWIPTRWIGTLTHTWPMQKFSRRVATWPWFWNREPNKVLWWSTFK